MPRPTISATATPQTLPLHGFLSLAREYCEETGLGLAFQKEVRGFFLKSLARGYWDSMRRYMASSAWPVIKACKAAGLDPSTHTRWDEMIPTFETICLLFARCDLEMKDVAFPNGHAALKSAFLKTVEHIRSKHLKESTARLDDETFECLRQVLTNPVVLRAVEKPSPAGEQEEDAMDLTAEFGRAMEAIACALRDKFPSGRIRSGAAVQQAVDGWLIPWVLIYIALPPAQWEC